MTVQLSPDCSLPFTNQQTRRRNSSDIIRPLPTGIGNLFSRTKLDSPHACFFRNDFKHQPSRLSANIPAEAWLNIESPAPGTWIRSTDNAPVTYTNWNFAGGKPDGTGENCAYINSGAGYTWDDINCSGPKKVVCESDCSPPPSGNS